MPASALACEKHPSAGTSIHGNCNDCRRKALGFTTPLSPPWLKREQALYQYIRSHPAFCKACTHSIDVVPNQFQRQDEGLMRNWQDRPVGFTVLHLRDGSHSIMVDDTPKSRANYLH